MTIPTLFTLLFLLPAISLHAQSMGLVNDYLQNVRNGSYDPVPEEILEDEAHHDQILEALTSYEKDSIVRVRSRAYNIAKRIGQGSTDANIRQEAVSQLVRGIADSDGGISGNCSLGLTGFRIEDFTVEDKHRLVDYLQSARPHLDQVVMLVGYLQIDEGAALLNQLLAESVNAKLKWSIRLALARMGEESAINYISTRLQTAPVNDNFIYDIVPDLIYTRRLEVFDFLEQIIMSEEQNCAGADPDRNDKILCGYRVLEYIAYAIEDFPIPTDQYGEAEISDYVQALNDVRNWFARNQAYTLKTDTY